MKIGINMYHLVPENGGVVQYVLTLLQHWPRLCPGDPLVLFCFPRNTALLEAVPAVFERRMLQDQDEIARSLAGIDVFFCPFTALYPRPLPLPSVVTIVDLQERFFPEFFSPEDMRNRFHHYDWSVALADHIVTISDFSRESIVRILGAERRRVTRIHLCPAELPETAAPPAAWKHEGEHPFLLYPANFWRHKNHRKLFAALAQLRAEGMRIPLVCTGALLGKEAEWLAELAQLGIQDQVEHMGLISRAELAWLYRRARGLCFPSLFEGFGIPVVEAMRSGTPVACSRTTSLPEIGGTAALYFNPRDTGSIAQALGRFWTDAELRETLVRRGRQQCRQFTAERLVRAHRECFTRALRTYSEARHRRNLAWVANPDPPRENLSVHERLTADELLRTHPVSGFKRLRRRLAHLLCP